MDSIAGVLVSIAIQSTQLSVDSCLVLHSTKTIFVSYGTVISRSLNDSYERRILIDCSIAGVMVSFVNWYILGDPEVTANIYC